MMAIEKLTLGDRLTGHLVDGVPDTPFQAAILDLSEQYGVRLEVPYVNYDEAGQFKHVREWFRGEAAPTNLVLHTADGPISFFGNRWSGYSENTGRNVSLGKLSPAETVLASRDGSLTDALRIQTVRSRLDGLNEWTRLTATTDERETDEEQRVQAVTYKLRSPEEVQWRHGDVTLTLRAEWRVEEHTDGYNRAVELSDNVVLESQFDDGPRSFFDHFVEQRKVASLLVFLYGRQISFREHKVRDERFASRMMDGRVYHHPFVELISERTVRERFTPVPSRKELGRAIAHLQQIGPGGLSEWSTQYDAWSRFILPSAGVLSRKRAFIEDRVISTSMSLEAAGAMIGERHGEKETYGRGRPSTATNIYRCLDLLQVDWGKHVASNVGLARAIANNYNDVKHADRGDFPNSEHTYLVSSVNSLLVRLLALHLTGKGDELLEPYRNGDELWDIRQRFESVAVSVTSDGAWAEVSNDDHL
ncbi:hypothetical protein NS263_01750 [Curtobacterium oceanosedimentum]|uniref:ApeA N-terminal domain-containing protein n=2 Tax=Curtobacterium oceanosedimentum TaxID=465820 RepID=A0ABR5S9J4_9MICO|nr:hypothetical protein NS263_01750 [Curtobacterium oceanosedimentum]